MKQGTHKVFNVYEAVYDNSLKRPRHIGNRKKLATFISINDLKQFMFKQVEPTYLGDGKTKYIYYKFEDVLIVNKIRPP